MRTEKNVAGQKKLSGKVLVYAAVGAYFAVVLAGGLLHMDDVSVIAPKLAYYMNPLIYGLVWLFLAGVLVLYGTISRRVVYAFSWLAALGYALYAAASGGSYFLTYGMCGVMAVMTVCVGRELRAEAGEKSSAKKEISPLVGKLTVAGGAVLTGGVTLYLLLATHLSYADLPAGNTAVFVQLMESLRTGFSFETTMAFGEAVSHFAAHISPIYLLFLPFYALIPSPVTLMVLEVAAVSTAVIPLWLLARRRGLSVGVTTVLCLLLSLSPAVWGGTAGMLHENALLLPLLLWLAWALEARRVPLVCVFSALALCVRETAAIYLFSIGLYAWLSSRRAGGERRARLTGLILAGASLIYFVTAMILLSTLGRGTLVTLYENLTGEYAAFFSNFLRELFLNPALVMYELLTETKLHYVAGLLLPLGCLPLLSRDGSGLVFILPFALHLLTDRTTYHNMEHPYSFALVAILCILSVAALSRLSEKRANENRAAPPLRVKRVLTIALVAAVVVGAFQLASYRLITEYAVEGRAEIKAMDELLAKVDPDASVSASARLCPHLSRGELYMLSHEADTDLVVIDLREEWTLAAEAAYDVEYYTAKGYTVVAEEAGVGVILRRG